MEADMERPTYESKWNPNTIISTISLVLMIAGGGAAYATMQGDMKEQRDKIDAQEKRMTKIEDKVQEMPLISVRVDNLASNVSAINNRMDSQFNDINANIRDMRELMNKLVTQSEVQSQILRRVEGNAAGTQRNN